MRAHFTGMAGRVVLTDMQQAQRKYTDSVQRTRVYVSLEGGHPLDRRDRGSRVNGRELHPANIVVYLEELLDGPRSLHAIELYARVYVTDVDAAGELLLEFTQRQQVFMASGRIRLLRAGDARSRRESAVVGYAWNGTRYTCEAWCRFWSGIYAQSVRVMPLYKRLVQLLRDGVSVYVPCVPKTSAFGSAETGEDGLWDGHDATRQRLLELYRAQTVRRAKDRWSHEVVLAMMLSRCDNYI